LRLAGRFAVSGEERCIKRFYKAVSIDECDGGYGVYLDGRQARTMMRKPLAAPSKSLAEAVAGEWDAQAAFIDRHTMPLTRLLSASIDGGEAAAGEWRQEILKYLGSDLLCYRASEPQTLVERQRDCWDPYLDWLRGEFGAALAVTTGVMTISQPKAALAPLEKALAGVAPHTLFVLKTATAISGSAILALALWRNAFPSAAIFEASRLDERFQQERWGEDADAFTREQNLRREFDAVTRFFELA